MAHLDRSSPPDSHSGEAGALPECAANLIDNNCFTISTESCIIDLLIFEKTNFDLLTKYTMVDGELKPVRLMFQRQPYIRMGSKSPKPINV